jgi:hypothetical protein
MPFADVEGIMAVALEVILPEMELVAGSICGEAKDERLVIDGGFGLWEIEREETGDSVVVGDDEDGFAFGEEAIAGMGDEVGAFLPTADAAEWIEMGWEGSAGEFADPACFVEEDDGGEAEGDSGGEARFDEAGAGDEALVPVEEGEDEEWDDGRCDPVRVNA